MSSLVTWDVVILVQQYLELGNQVSPENVAYLKITLL